MCLPSETGGAPGGAPWRRRSISVLRSRISAKPSSTAPHAASGSRDRDRATALNLLPEPSGFEGLVRRVENAPPDALPAPPPACEPDRVLEGQVASRTV